MTDFASRWNEFWTSHNTIPSLIGFGDAVAKFKGEYINLRAEWVTGLKQKTSAPSGEPTSITWPSWLPWWLIPAGGAVAAVVIVVPAVAPIVASAITKKAALKAAMTVA